MVLVLTPLPPAVSPVYSGPLAMLLAPSTTPTTLPFSIPIPILKTVVRPLFYMQWVQCTVAPVCCTLYQFQYQYHCQYPYQFQYQYHCPSLLPQVGWFSAVAPQQCSFIFHLGIGFSICNGISIGIDNGVIVSNDIGNSIGILVLVLLMVLVLVPLLPPVYPVHSAVAFWRCFWLLPTFLNLVKLNLDPKLNFNCSERTNQNQRADIRSSKRSETNNMTPIQMYPNS